VDQEKVLKKQKKKKNDEGNKEGKKSQFSRTERVG
jgi:hypothetical protein